jgi:hypothetical protein
MMLLVVKRAISLAFFFAKFYNFVAGIIDGPGVELTSISVCNDSNEKQPTTVAGLDSFHHCITRKQQLLV